MGTWFLPLSTRTLVTRPNGMPRWTISASVTSLGMLRIWTTRDGLAGLLGSNFTCCPITNSKKTKIRLNSHCLDSHPSFLGHWFIDSVITLAAARRTADNINMHVATLRRSSHAVDSHRTDDIDSLPALPVLTDCFFKCIEFGCCCHHFCLFFCVCGINWVWWRRHID